MTRLLAAQEIETYAGPQWLVTLRGEPPLTPSDTAFSELFPFQVLDRNIRGWGDFNAIIRVPAGDGDEGFYCYDFLAKLEDLDGCPTARTADEMREMRLGRVAAGVRDEGDIGTEPPLLPLVPNGRDGPHG